MPTASLGVGREPENRFAPIELLLVRPDDCELRELENTLRSIVSRYGPMVHMRVVNKVPESLGRANRPDCGVQQPLVLVVRDGQVVGEAMGSLLPARELDRVVRCAVEWPSQPI